MKETAVTGVIPTFTAGERPEDVPPPEEKTEQATGAELPLVENGAVKASGTYRIPWFSTGTITVGENLDVTLCGEESSFENLTLTVGNGTKLALKNVSITGDRALLKLAGGNVLTLSERNELDGRSDTPENENPTVTVGGDLTINGTGSLCVSAQVNNAAIYVNSGSTLHQNGGTLSIFKTDKLGFAGGAFYANGSTYELTGGTLCGRTDSDNVAVLSADSVTVTGDPRDGREVPCGAAWQRDAQGLHCNGLWTQRKQCKNERCLRGRKGHPLAQITKRRAVERIAPVHRCDSGKALV